MKKLSLSQTNVEQLLFVDANCFDRERWNAEMFEEELCPTNTFSSVFAYIENDKIVGFVCVQNVEQLELLKIALLPQYRGRGIAEEMLRFVLRWAKESGKTQCNLEVNVSNGRAISLYRKLGFETVCTRKNFYALSDYDTHDAFTMICTL